MHVRSVLKPLFWVLALLAGLAMIAALAFAAINWKDKRPSEAAQRLENVFNARPLIGAAKNGLVHMLGLNVPPGHEVVDVGSARMAWLEQQGAGHPAPRTVFPDKLEQAASRPAPELAPLIAACKNLDGPCEQALKKNPALAEEWAASEKWLAERYDAMLATEAWHDGNVAHPTLPAPSFHAAREGQRQLFVRAWLAARTGDAAATQALLARDLAFWRRVLASSSNLVRKMVAAFSIDRHFQWSSLVLRTLPFAQQLDAVPASWHAELTPAERSMQLVMAGEYKVVQAILGQVEFAQRAKPWPKSMRHRLSGFQKQDSLNRYAGYVSSVADTLNVPYAQLPAAVARAGALRPDLAPRSFLDRFYNMSGKAMLAVPADLASYAVRVADLEGVRRAALLTAQLRAENVPTEQMQARLNAAVLRNPYTGQPLVWDAASAAVLFTGMRKVADGRYLIFY